MNPTRLSLTSSIPVIYGRFQDFAYRGLQPLYFDFDEEICGVTVRHRNVLAILPGTLPES